MMSELRKCSRCHSSKLEQYFSVKVKGELYKLCHNCRHTQEEYRDEEWKEKTKDKIKTYYQKSFQQWLYKP
jgi:recombinational DNA repair protein (RecF pathway)